MAAQLQVIHTRVNPKLKSQSELNLAFTTYLERVVCRARRTFHMNLGISAFEYSVAGVKETRLLMSY